MSGITRVFATALTAAIFVCLQRLSCGDDSKVRTLVGFTQASANTERTVENRLDAFLDSTRVDRDFRELTREPHVAGSERNNELAHFVAASFRSVGLEEVAETSYDVLMSYPKAVSVEMVSPRPFSNEERRGHL